MRADRGVQLGLACYHVYNLSLFINDSETLTNCSSEKYKQY